MPKKIVIIGGGFAGVNLVKELTKNTDLQVTLVDRNNYNYFTPLLYQVATGYLDTSAITYPFRNLFRGRKNFRFFLGELLEVIPEKNTVITSNGLLDYDYLVMSTGTHTNFFGLDRVEQHAIPMKTLEDALQMRNVLLQRLEKASRIKDKQERLPWLTMVIAGGGPTGVEVSGIFAELRKHTIRKEFPELIDSGAKIHLINGGDEVLSPMSEKSQEYALQKLRKMGVEVQLNTRVVDFDGERVFFKDGTFIHSKNLIWATGVTCFIFKGFPKEVYERGNRLRVDEVNRVDGMRNIYAIGDTCMQTSDPDFPEGHPQLAQVAIQQGVHLAKNLEKIAQAKDTNPFRYNDKGSMAIIGSSSAVADIPKPKMHFNGFAAWFIWAVIHLFSLINYRNRLRTFYSWAIEYLTQNQDLRMIVQAEDKVEVEHYGSGATDTVSP